jgi:integrase
LQTIEIIPEQLISPFTVPNEFKVSKRPNSKSVHKTQSWINFEDHEVVHLYQEALVRGEETLAQLIKIAAYTGARIEEICSLKKAQVNLQKNSIQIINAIRCCFFIP